MLMRMAQIEEEKNGREREPKRKTLGKCSYTMAGTGQGQVLKLENSSSLLKYSTVIRWNTPVLGKQKQEDLCLSAGIKGSYIVLYGKTDNSNYHKESYLFDNDKGVWNSSPK